MASLQVFETGDNTAVPLNTDGATTLTDVDSIAIPLRIDQDNTSFAFTRSLNGSDNSDAITFEYEPDEEYLNRACGFKAIYNNLTFTRPAGKSRESLDHQSNHTHYRCNLKQ